MTNQKSQCKTKISSDTESKGKKPSDNWREITRNTVHHFYNRGWVQNLLIGLALIFLTPMFGYIVNTKLGIIFGGALGITIIVWIVAFTLASEATKAATPIPQVAIQTTAAPPTAPKPLAMSPADIISQYALDRDASISAGTGSGGVQPAFSTAVEGQLVEWQLYLVKVNQSTSDAGDLEVRCSDKGNPEAFVIFNTTSFDHDFLRASIAKDEQMFTVTGTIQRVGTSEIWLTNADIQLVSATGL